MLALRLFLPESWTSNRARLNRPGVPAEYRTARTKPELALVEIDRAIAAGVRFGCVLADAGYGLSAPFRQGLTARKLAWAVGIPRHLKVYPADVRMIWPVAKRGRPLNGTFLTFYRYRLKTCWPTPNGTPSVGAPARKESSRLVSPLSGCGSPMDQHSGSGTKASNIYPGTRLGLSANTGCRERRNTISPTCRTDLRTLAATIKARWICEQAHQQMKEELGLDHFEGRSWQGLHRHALMTMIAYAFLQHRRLATARREKKINGPPPQPTLPAVRHAILELFAPLPPQRCPHCRKPAR